jgi:hypothetical protein
MQQRVGVAPGHSLRSASVALPVIGGEDTKSLAAESMRAEQQYIAVRRGIDRHRTDHADDLWELHSSPHQT